MGISARFYTLRKITFEKVKEAIESEFGVPVDVRAINDCDDKYWYKFQFTLKCGEHRDLSFFPRSVDKETWGTEEVIDKGEYTCFSFNAWGKSTEILTRIGEHFGGYLDADDCDDELDVLIIDKVKQREDKLKSILDES